MSVDAPEAVWYTTHMVQPPPIVEDSGYACVECGYDLSASPIGSKCPECGRPIVESLKAREPGKKKTLMATLSLVLGIVSVFVFPFAGPVAIYVSHRTREKMKLGGYDDSCQQMARAGLALGIAGTVLIVPLMVWITIRAAGWTF